MKVKHFKIAYKPPPTLDVCHLTQFGKVPQKVPQLWVTPPSSSVVPEISVFTLRVKQLVAIKALQPVSALGLQAMSSNFRICPALSGFPHQSTSYILPSNPL